MRLFGIFVEEAVGKNVIEVHPRLSRNLDQIVESIASKKAKIIFNMLNFARKSDAILKTHDLATLLLDTVELAKSDYDLKNHEESRFILRLKKETNMVRIEIEDNGPWMNADIQKRLFLSAGR